MKLINWSDYTWTDATLTDLFHAGAMADVECEVMTYDAVGVQLKSGEVLLVSIDPIDGHDCSIGLLKKVQ